MIYSMTMLPTLWILGIWIVLGVPLFVLWLVSRKKPKHCRSCGLECEECEASKNPTGIFFTCDREKT